MRSFIRIFLLWLLLCAMSHAQDFMAELYFIPDADTSLSCTRSFGGSVKASDGYDENDVFGPPPGLIYYAYFRIAEFPRYLWHDIQQWNSPYAADKMWTIHIANAEGKTTLISWNPGKLPVVDDRQFLLTSGDSVLAEMANDTHVTITGSAVLQIRYVQKKIVEHTLSIQSEPHEGGTTVPVRGSYHYSAGQVVPLSAYPADGFQFSHWNGAVQDSTQQFTTIVMEQNQTVTACFSPMEFTLAFEIHGNGEILVLPEKTIFKFHEIVQITAKPESCWTFSHWGGDLSGQTNPHQVTLDKNLFITATFTPVPKPRLVVLPPEQINFGATETGKTDSMWFYLQNDGNDLLQVFTIQLTGEQSDQFSLKHKQVPLEILPENKEQVKVLFHPQSLGDKNAKIIISGNDSENSVIEIIMSGTGVRSVIDSRATFAYPNPFNPEIESINIVFFRTGKSTSIEVLDVHGDAVRMLEALHTNNINQQELITWDGRNAEGDIVARGVYFYLIENSSGEHLVGKIAVLR